MFITIKGIKPGVDYKPSESGTWSRLDRISTGSLYNEIEESRIHSTPVYWVFRTEKTHVGETLSVISLQEILTSSSELSTNLMKDLWEVR